MKKVFLGVGHGGKDKGAVKYLVEADVNLNMALACRDYLVANGVEVKMSREKDENDTLAEEIKECNAYNPDLAVDIHNNAGGGDGFEVFYSYKGGTSKTLAQNIEVEVKTIGQNSRGCKIKLNSKGNADYYGFIRQTKCPAVITEGVFVDNANDVKIADTLEEQKAFGVAIAKGILKTLGINSNNVVSTKKSVEEIAKEVIAGKWGTGSERRTKLTNAGYDYNLVQSRVNDILTVSNIQYYPKCKATYLSITKALDSIGVDSSFANRKKIALANGIKNYTGTFVQNVSLLNKLKAGKLRK